MTLLLTEGFEFEVWNIWCIKPPRLNSIVRARYAGDDKDHLVAVCSKGCCVWHLESEETMTLPDLWQEIPEEEGK